MRPEEVLNEEELEELRRSGQVLYRDGSRLPDEAPAEAGSGGKLAAGARKEGLGFQFIRKEMFSL
jgi:hypothetical protein